MFFSWQEKLTRLNILRIVHAQLLLLFKLNNQGSLKQYFQDKNTLITANLVIISNFDKYIWSWLSDHLDYWELNLILSESYLKIMTKTKTHNQFTHSYMYTYRVHLQYLIKPINFYIFPKKYRRKNCLINDWINKYYYVIQWQHCKVEAIFVIYNLHPSTSYLCGYLKRFFIT